MPDGPRLRLPARCFALVLLSCAPQASGPPPAPAPNPAVTAASVPTVPAAELARHETPRLRLPGFARPTGYEVLLDLDPARSEFAGEIRIALEFSQASDHLWLNAQDITVDRAELSVGGARLPVTTEARKPDFLLLALPRPVGPGAATLDIRYRGKARRHDGDGIYRVEENGASYLFTQFEATDARQAFPCFDEPSYKVPWQLVIRTPRAHVAVANTPVLSEQPQPDGWKTVRFAPTKPLPSYLIAFAVGPLELIEAGHSRSGVPLRIVVPRGRGADAAYPVEVTREILALMEDELGTPYPFEKLDSAAVPVFNAGAMENPGLVTYRQNILLVKPGELTRSRQRSYAGVAAHELAHMWFGNLVTPQWWDDIWLNEAFATWMADKIMVRWKPEWKRDVGRVQSRSQVMSQDSLASARMIRQPVASANDIQNAFDGITYNKGAAVLHMFERWVGEPVFRRGVQAYLANHARGNARYEDFVGAISAAAGKDMRPLFDGFVSQTGVPLVTFELHCPAGKPAELQLAQRHYARLGATPDANRTWQIPVCVRHGRGKQAGRACTLLTEKQASMTLDRAAGCPQWVLPNEDGTGYYRALPRGALLAELLARAATVLTLPERLGLLGDVSALVASGDVSPEAALTLAEKLAADPDRRVVEASMAIVTRVEDMVPGDLRDRYERFIRRVYGPRAHALGWASHPGEDEDSKELRPGLLELVANEGGDHALIHRARVLAEKWLQDRKAIEPELVSSVLSVAAHHGDAVLFERIYQEAKKTTSATGDRQDRGRLLGALADFRGPALIERMQAIALGPDFEPRESLGLLSAAFRERDTQASAFAFWKQHFDEIVARLPTGMRAGSVRSLTSLCDERYRPDIESFFRPKVITLDGGPRVMNQVLEQLSLCAVSRKAQSPGVIAFLTKRT